MKKIFALLFAFVASFGLLTSCEFGQKTPTQPETPTAPSISQELQNAKNYIKNVYQASEGKVTANMVRPAEVKGGNKTFTVTWSVEVTSGDANAVSVAKAEDGKTWNINVKYDNTITAEVKFILTATISSAEESTTYAFNYNIPVFQANTVSQFLSEKDEDKVYFLEGVITAVNKASGKTAFVLSDATGSVFCYAGLEVEVGQKVQVTGNYGENASYPQIVNPTLVKVLAENQDVEAASGDALVTTVLEINNAAKAEGVTAEDLATAYKGKYLEITGYVVLSSTGFANFAVAADVASCCNLYANENINLKQYVSAKVVVKGFARGVSVGNGLTIQVQSAELAPGETMPEQPKEEFKEPAVTNKTIAEIAAIPTADELKATYKVTTYVTKLGKNENDTAAGDYGNLWVGEGETNILVYGTTATASALIFDKTTGKYSFKNPKDYNTNELTKDIKVGDKVELLVAKTSYNGTAQIYAIVLSVNAEEGTTGSKIQEILDAAASLADKEKLQGTYTVEGTIKEITGAYSDQFKNITFILTDGVADILVFRSKGDCAATLKVGDKVTVSGEIIKYGETIEFQYAALTTGEAADEPTEEPAPTPEDPVELPEGALAAFEFGANGEAAHADGNDLGAEAQYVCGDYTLSLTGMSKVFGPAFDAKGNSCIKLGTGKVIGTFSFTVGEDVKKVVIYVAQYKTNDTKVKVNGTETTVSTASNDGAYTAIEIDTTTTKTISLETVTGAYRAMINSVVFYGAE